MINLSEMSCEEIRDAAVKGKITELAILQQSLISVLEEKNMFIEKEMEIRQKLEGVY